MLRANPDDTVDTQEKSRNVSGVGSTGSNILLLLSAVMVVKGLLLPEEIRCEMVFLRLGLRGGVLAGVFSLRIRLQARLIIFVRNSFYSCLHRAVWGMQGS